MVNYSPRIILCIGLVFGGQHKLPIVVLNGFLDHIDTF